MYTTDWIYTTWNRVNTDPETGESSPGDVTVLTSGLTDNYLDVVSSSGKSYFLGFKLNNNNEVTNAYACGIKNGIPFCIEGTLRKWLGGIPEYETNKSILQSASLWNNTCQLNTYNSGTQYEYEKTSCLLVSNSVEAFADEIGTVQVGVDTNNCCIVDSFGTAFCDES